jgi:curli biogenesis system outer membrane secretion channel CsgG
MAISTRLTLSLLAAASFAFPQAPAAPAAKAPPAATKAPAAAPKAAAKAAPKALSPLDEVKRMVRLKLPEQAIINQIQALGPKLKVTPEQLVELKELGASDAVIVAASGAGAAPAAAAASPAPAPAPAPAAMPKAEWNTDLSKIACAAPAGAAKRVIAVDTFDYGTVRSAVQAIFGTQVDIGKGIQSLMMKRLAETGKYRVVERQNLAKIMAEQDLGASNRAARAPNARIGRIVGADAILMGTIVTFGRDDQRRSVSLGGYVPKVFGRGAVGVGEDKAVVAISYRLVDAETSEIIDQGEARGESKRKAKVFDIAGGSGGRGGAAGYDMTSANFAETIIGEATIATVDQLADQANKQEPKVRKRNLEVETRVADVSGARVYLAAGTNEGVSMCDRFEIFRVRREITDPVTKEVIDYDLEKMGDLVVTEVRDRVAIGAYQGSAAPEPKMLARKVAGK